MDWGWLLPDEWSLCETSLTAFIIASSVCCVFSILIARGLILVGLAIISGVGLRDLGSGGAFDDICDS